LASNEAKAAQTLGISIDHFERHVKPDIPVVCSGALRLYPLKVLERWLDERAIHDGRGV
jgi:hypothetical protein